MDADAAGAGAIAVVIVNGHLTDMMEFAELGSAVDCGVLEGDLGVHHSIVETTEVAGDVGEDEEVACRAGGGVPVADEDEGVFLPGAEFDLACAALMLGARVWDVTYEPGRRGNMRSSRGGSNWSLRDPVWFRALHCPDCILPSLIGISRSGIGKRRFMVRGCLLVIRLYSGTSSLSSVKTSPLKGVVLCPSFTACW